MLCNLLQNRFWWKSGWTSNKNMDHSFIHPRFNSVTHVHKKYRTRNWNDYIRVDCLADDPTFSERWTFRTIQLKTISITRVLLSTLLYLYTSYSPSFSQQNILPQQSINSINSHHQKKPISWSASLKIVVIQRFKMVQPWSTWDVVVPWLRRWLSTGGSWVWLPL